MARTVVQKFGGSSVADVAKIRAVAQRVKQRRDEGWQVVVVVSAMGDTTDELLALAHSISSDPPRRELDMLLTCGERISMALMSMALQGLGVPAISFTGSQSGIITDDAHAQARIIEVKPARIEEELAKQKVVIVAGYQGVSRQREVTTLGRGGSDTSAVALAAALQADCEIYSDVDGVFSADPRIVPQAKKLATLSFEEMQELATAGAKVLNAQAVEFAREAGITIHARSTHTAGTGTEIRATDGGATPSRVKGVTCDAELWVLSVPDSAQVPAVLACLDSFAVRGRQLMVDGHGRSLVVVPLQDVHGPEAIRAALPVGTQVLNELATVTAVGAGLHTDWSLVAGVLEVCRQQSVAPVALFSSNLQVTVLVERAQAKTLTALVHRRLVEGAPS